jgi:hypothetical protein
MKQNNAVGVPEGDHAISCRERDSIELSTLLQGSPSLPGLSNMVRFFERMIDGALLLLGYIALIAMPMTALLILVLIALKLWHWLS